MSGAQPVAAATETGTQTKKLNDRSRARIKFTGDRSYGDSSICGRFCFPDVLRELDDLQPRFVHRPRPLPVFLSAQLRRPAPVADTGLSKPSTGPFEEIEKTPQDSELPRLSTNEQGNLVVKTVEVSKKPIFTRPLLLPSLSQQRT